MSGGTSAQSSNMVARMFPGAWGDGARPKQAPYYDMSRLLAGESADWANQGANLWGNSPYTAQLNDLLSGKMGSITDDPTNKGFLDSLMDVTGGRSAASGLGAPTQAALASDIAPTLAAMRDSTIQELLGAESQNYMQDIGSSQTFQSLAELAMPQVAAGNNSSGYSHSLGLCCFIFMEAYDGVLLDVVRRYRDEHLTERNRRGYYRIADKIVPLMKKSQLFKKMVKLLMTDPMVSYGRWYYGEGGIGSIFKPITAFWLSVFNLLGGGKYTRKNGEVI